MHLGSTLSSLFRAQTCPETSGNLHRWGAYTGLGVQGTFGFVSLKFLSPTGALYLSTRLVGLLQYLLWRFFFKVDCDSHSVPLQTMSLPELFANQICYVAVSHVRIFTFSMASSFIFAATAFITDGLFCQWFRAACTKGKRALNSLYGLSLCL